jgi:hypothetical protein
MLDRLAALAHRLRVRVETPLHSFEQVLMLPPRNASLRSHRALRARGTRGGPYASVSALSGGQRGRAGSIFLGAAFIHGREFQA